MQEHVDQSAVQTQKLLAAERNRTKQLQAELAKTKAGRNFPAKPPEDKPPKKQAPEADAEGFVEVPAKEWMCFACKTKHTNMAKQECRNKDCLKPRGVTPPVETAVVVADLGPAATKEARKLWRNLGATTLQEATAGAAPEGSAAVSETPGAAAAQGTERLVSNLTSQLTFLKAQEEPQDLDAIASAQKRLDKLTATPPTQPPRASVGKLQLLLDKQLKWLAEQDSSEQAAIDKA